jgi:hypothetical protein
MHEIPDADRHSGEGRNLALSSKSQKEFAHRVAFFMLIAREYDT